MPKGMLKTAQAAGERIGTLLSPQEQAELMEIMKGLAMSAPKMRNAQTMARVQPVLQRSAADPDLGPALQSIVARKGVPAMTDLNRRAPRPPLRAVRHGTRAVRTPCVAVRMQGERRMSIRGTGTSDVTTHHGPRCVQPHQEP